MLPRVMLSSAWSSLESSPCAVAIGNFDGVHVGHRALVERLVERASGLHLPALAYTLDPLPVEVFRPGHEPGRIMALDDRVRLLGELGVDIVCVERFSRAFAARSAQWFAREVLDRRLQARFVLVGHDFHFGVRREGDAALLRAELVETPVEEMRAVRDADGVVSSSRVRVLLQAGQVELAARVLGRPHGLRGTVVMGRQVGRTIGFPTANIEVEGMLCPARGVYAAWAWLDGQGPWPGVVNHGTRPTFSGDRTSLEVHVLSVPEDQLVAPWYGREMRLAFVGRIRDEMCFPGAVSLRERIATDVRLAVDLLGTGRPTAVGG